MIQITAVENINGKKRIALLDTSSVSFLQRLSEKGIPAEEILKDYDLILIPCWVLEELNDAVGRAAYVQRLIDVGYPIFSISEEAYSDLAKKEEGNLYQIVLASTYQIGRIKSYLRRFVEKNDILDMESYRIWINQLYEEWPIPGEVLSSGRIKKKNAGEISITILAEVVSWYYPEMEGLTIYSQDGDTYEFQRKAEERFLLHGYQFLSHTKAMMQSFASCTEKKKSAWKRSGSAEKIYEESPTANNGKINRLF